MADSSTFISSLERLKGRQNYSTWKFQMENVFKHEGLWACIVGYVPSDTTTQAVRDRNEEKTLAKINLAIEKSAYPHVVKAKTAAEAWTQLEKAYEDKGLSRKIRLLRRLTAVRLEDFQSMEEFVNEAISLSQLLASMDMALNDELGEIFSAKNIQTPSSYSLCFPLLSQSAEKSSEPLTAIESEDEDDTSDSEVETPIVSESSESEGATEDESFESTTETPQKPEELSNPKDQIPTISLSTTEDDSQESSGSQEKTSTSPHPIPTIILSSTDDVSQTSSSDGNPRYPARERPVEDE
ncbi:hypothetical protein GE061_007577 [Apolygus lucorum]|uniref:DUF4219 domain-containing protein n=1 Tax=Apolygus lucorum TaxID=248454 RepID=A0A8S9WTU5_APOLU|nr:hypothetical protein GE061_007577 [Apolygus lucorum]